MPEMRGVELVRQTEKVRPDLPVLMMSGYTTPMFEEERRAIASVPLVEKPFSGAALLDEVRALIDGRREG